MANLDRQTYKSSWNPNVAEMVLKFTDDSGAGAAGTYAADVTVPAGAYIIDVQIHGVALWNAGTYPPINGLIGNDAKSEWLKPENKHLIPKGSFLLNKENEIVETKKGNNDFEKFLFYGMAIYIGFPILF